MEVEWASLHREALLENGERARRGEPRLRLWRGLGPYLHLPPLQEEGVDRGPALGVGGLPGPGQGLRGHLGLVQGKGDQAVGLGELPQEVSLPQEIGEDPVQLGQPLRRVYHASLPWTRAAL
ncbi:MAG: hypothetical protein KNN15_13030 [Thermus antranikianii]|nr:MAG: hypothetical protein KNN15_13030 [Thermus antranikianii]